MKLLRILAAGIIGAGLVTTVSVAPASAITDYGFGPFENSSVDCGQSTYISSMGIKYWACAWHTKNSSGHGHVKTGIVIQNYGGSTRGVVANWARWYDLQSYYARQHSQTFGTGVSLPAGETKTLWDWYEYDTDVYYPYYYGTRGRVRVVSGSTTLATGAFAYSPLQSPYVGCRDGNSVENWVDTRRNCTL
jgi:hypothetical protein